MPLTFMEKVTLGLSGLTVISIGSFIAMAPQVFYATYGISLGDDPSLLSEIRAPAACLFALGVLMLLGIWRAAMVPMAVTAAFIVFLAFPVGRLIGVVADGVPSAGILGAFGLEIAIAVLCIFAFGKRVRISL